MITNVNISPTFQSKVIIAGYKDLDVITRHGMSINRFKEQLDELSSNGDDNTVTLVHEKGKPGFMMYINTKEERLYQPSYIKMTSCYVGFVPAEYYDKIKNSIFGVKKEISDYDNYVF